MKQFDRLIAAAAALIILIFAAANLLPEGADSGSRSRPWRVEINRIAREIEAAGPEAIDLSDYTCVTHVEQYKNSGGDFFSPDSDYALREIGGVLYRFDYRTDLRFDHTSLRITLNVSLALMSLLLLGILLYVRHSILRPFETLSQVPYELSRGNLTPPLKEQKSRYFGRFIWGVDLLREHMEQQKERELALQKDRKTLLLSLSHDVKTPLSAIKLYSSALTKGLYEDHEQQLSIAANINRKADEIEGYVSEIIRASREDFLDLTVAPGEFYLSELLEKLGSYYEEKLSLVRTELCIDPYGDCLLKGDRDRCLEVLQNIMENAVKYGDGRYIAIRLTEEDGCQLITVANSGNTLPEEELPHIFDSFYRGSNTNGQQGSGLGLYICRRLMRQMNGEIFASPTAGEMCITVVIEKA